MTTILSSDGEPSMVDDRRCVERLSDPALIAAFERIGALPSPPTSLVLLNRILAQPDFNLGDVVDVVVSDVATAARLLRLANSAFFGLSKPVSDLRSAVAFLGVAAVRNLVVAGDVLAGLSECSPLVARARAAISDHGTAVAELACSLTSDRNAASEVYAGALLHDIGVLLLGEAFSDASEAIGDPGGPEITHAEAGAYLLHRWGLPGSIVEIVLHHHDAPQLGEGTVDGVHATYVADALVGERCPEAAWWEEGAEPLDPTYLEALGLTRAVATWRECPARLL